MLGFVLALKTNFFNSFFEVRNFYRFWSVLERFWEGLGRVWGRFGEGLGKVWARYGEVLGMKFSSHWRNEGRPADCALRSAAPPGTSVLNEKGQVLFLSSCI